jgi:hypothetical protein
MNPLQRSFAAWLVILSLLLGGLTPLVAQAGAQGGPAAMTICSTSIHKPGQAPAKTDAAHVHCVYCCGGTDDTPILQRTFIVAAYIPGAGRASRMTTASDFSYHQPKSKAQPRAPPAIL